MLLAVPLTGVTAVVIGTLDRWSLDPAVEQLAAPYLSIILWSILPLLLYTAFRRYLQALGVVTPIMAALVSANLINVLVNWLLIFGNLGAPRLGVDGAAWATCVSRVYLALFLLLDREDPSSFYAPYHATLPPRDGRSSVACLPVHWPAPAPPASSVR